MGNYYVLTGQGPTKSWGNYDIPIDTIKNIEFYLWGFDPKALKGRADNKYIGSGNFFVYKGLVPAFGRLKNLRNFCKQHNFKLVKPKLLKPNPNLILQLVKAGAPFQSAEVVFTKPIPQRIMDNLKKSHIKWSLQQNGGAFNILKVFV